MKKFDVVIAGYTCVDLIPDFTNIQSVENISDLFIPGKLIEIDGMDFSPGGVVANTGLAMKKFKKRIFLNGLTGNDFLGKIVREWFDKYELSEGIKTAAEASTGFGLIIAPPGIDRIFLEFPGCNHIFDISYINFDAISQCRLFHFGYPPLLKQFYQDRGSQLSKMFSEIQRMGVITSLDFSLPDPESESGKINWYEILQRVLPFTDIFVPSLEEVMKIMMPSKYDELLSLSGNNDIIDQIPINIIRKIGKQIMDMGVKILLIKAAHRGAYLLTANVTTINNRGFNLIEESWNKRELWCNAYLADHSKIKNATGAGDTAVAAFLSAIFDGMDSESSLKYAAMAGRNSLYCHHLYEELSDWDEMTAQMESEPNELIYF